MKSAQKVEGDDGEGERGWGGEELLKPVVSLFLILPPNCFAFLQLFDYDVDMARKRISDDAATCQWKSESLGLATVVYSALQDVRRFS